MANIEKITIKGSSGYCNYDEAYTDKLVITAESISYECKPMIDENESLYQKWTYKTTSEKFYKQFQKIASEIEIALCKEYSLTVTNIRIIKFIVVYSDGSTRKKDYYLPGYEFEELFKLIRKLVPSYETVPNVLQT